MVKEVLLFAYFSLVFIAPDIPCLAALLALVSEVFYLIGVVCFNLLPGLCPALYANLLSFHNSPWLDIITSEVCILLDYMVS